MAPWSEERFCVPSMIVDLDNISAARKAVQTLVDQFYSHILEFAKKYLELEEPRDDYRGFLELSAFISQRCSWSCNPNDSLHASDTLDGQSYLRDKDVLVPWPIQIDNARTKWYSLVFFVCSNQCSNYHRARVGRGPLLL